MEERVGRSASSPGTRRGAREGRGRLESPASLVANSGQRPKGTACWRRLGMFLSDSFGRDAPIIEAESTASLRVASINDKKMRPELGFRHACRELRRGRTGGPRVFTWRRRILIDRRGRRPSSGASERRRWIQRRAALYRAASVSS
jgi:hypothetical protein